MEADFLIVSRTFKDDNAAKFVDILADHPSLDLANLTGEDSEIPFTAISYALSHGSVNILKALFNHPNDKIKLVLAKMLFTPYRRTESDRVGYSYLTIAIINISYYAIDKPDKILAKNLWQCLELMLLFGLRCRRDLQEFSQCESLQDIKAPNGKSAVEKVNDIAKIHGSAGEAINARFKECLKRTSEMDLARLRGDSDSGSSDDANSASSSSSGGETPVAQRVAATALPATNGTVKAQEGENWLQRGLNSLLGRRSSKIGTITSAPQIAAKSTNNQRTEENVRLLSDTDITPVTPMHDSQRHGSLRKRDKNNGTDPSAGGPSQSASNNVSSGAPVHHKQQ